ncbi:hypothetical protein PanWU01x14_275310 [Parasponia andersonii]|uniref:Uncharacterized protein n=1 Tax=Parasponia andersonii TaxID=3476 RepID=A0A2P5B3H9_PARAD|nr:hypothetical protein PanWU01x14_275310 [Parasponia andersonii]
MAQFPPNPDDGELWLPSDIFLNEVSSKRGLHHFSCMDDLAQRLATVTFLKQRSLSKPPLKTPPNRFGPVPVHPNPFPQKCSKTGNGFENGQSLYGYRLVHNYGNSAELFYEYPLQKPVQAQVNVFLETRARVLQKQQNRLRNQLFPCREKSGFGVGGFVRLSGGTGVFHPRVSNTTTTTSSPASSTAFSSALVTKKQVFRRRQENQVLSQRNSTRVVGVHKEDSHHQLHPPPPEMGLPQDWTY